MKYKNLIIVGTSHIARQSVEEVSSLIEKETPTALALELDKGRFFALLSKKRQRVGWKDLREIGLKGYLFAAIGAYIERKLGESVGVQPGSEMLTAIKLARQKRIKILLIDQDIMITLKRFSAEITWKERFRLITDIIKGILFGKREARKLGIKKLDLTKVPSRNVIKRMIKEVKARYPNIYKVLVQERNEFMARNLIELMKREEKVLAIVGAGHEEEIMNIVKKTKDI